MGGAMHGTLVRWTRWAARVPVAVRVAVLMLALAMVVSLDYATGPDVILTFPYALCAMAAAWFISQRWGLIAAAVSLVAIVVVEAVSLDHANWGVLAANTVLRGLSFAVFAVLTAAVRRSFTDLVDTTRLDEMTGILSRRGFLDELGAARRRAVERRAPLGVVYLDLDGLKEVNDTEGHAAGDALLRRFVDGVAGHLRATDVFGRLGGDEFAIVLERADPLVIDGVIGRLMRDSNIPHVSCGVQVFEDRYPTAQEMLAGADRRMYADKERRRAARTAD
jgi:diguanylate cyclase (GGDEF)-like protein